VRAIWQQRQGQHFCVERNHSRVSVLNLKDEPALVMICIVCTLISHLSTFFFLVKMNLRPDLCVTLCIFPPFSSGFLSFAPPFVRILACSTTPLHYQFLFPLVFSLSLSLCACFYQRLLCPPLSDWLVGGINIRSCGSSASPAQKPIGRFRIEEID
jgi:hypothetical protein